MEYSKPIEAIIQRTREATGESKTTQGFIAHMRNIASITASLEGVIQNRNPSDTQAGHIKKVHRAGERLDKSLAQFRKHHNELLNNSMAELQAQLDSRTGLSKPTRSEDIMLQSEARQALLRMKDKDRHEVVREAVKNSDTLTLNAVFQGAPYLTGMDPKYLADMREAYETQKAPDVRAEMEALFEADSALSAAINAAARAAKESQNPEQMTKIVAAEEAAAAADRAFGETFQG